ncbi:MAG TPA: DegT/DnrJ/EryC1/StrS family aminotransferase [Methylomirabilota bacterium]|nr:DegT/DnrJ/EryC1/StrS family aminotransferase [Methylomirabilota bacterium]
MHIPLLDLTREIRDIRPEVEVLWRGLLERPQFLNGEHVKSFEREMADFLGVSHVVGTASGTEALILGLAACGIGEQDEVILPANAFIAALEAVWWLKARPVLVDVQDWDLGPDPEQIRRKLTRRTKALVVVHLYGLPVNLEPLLEICRTAGIQLIEDCSHAHGALYRQRKVGGFGAVGCFSTGVVKNLGAFGEAGFVATQDESIARQLRLLRAHGQEEKNVHLCYGANGRLDEMQAAILRLKLRSLEERNARRREIARLYTEAFATLDITLPWEDAQRVGVYHQYVIRTRQREALRAHLRARGIETGVHYPSPLHRQPAWRKYYRQALSLPNAERAAQEILSLPVFPDLTSQEIDAVIDGVQSFFAGERWCAPRPQVSVVVPFYNEAGNVTALHQEIRSAADTLGKSYECVYVNDGSTDGTALALDEIAREDARVRVVHMSQNQGEAAALSAGFQHARGRIIVTLDGDGQNDPHDIPVLLAKMAEGYPVVSGWRRQRQEDYWKRILPSRLANGLIAWATGVPVHDCGCGLKAYRREMLAGLSLPKGMHRFLPVILRVPPEAVAEIPVNDRTRHAGSSHYGLSRVFAVLRDLLPVHCIRRGPQLATRLLLGAAALATVLLGWLVREELIANSPGALTILAADIVGLLYLSLGYQRLREFLKAQETSSQRFTEDEVEIEGRA